MRCVISCAFRRFRSWARSASTYRCMTSCCLPSRGGPMPNRQLELQTMLHSLRLPTMAQVCADLALKSVKEGLSHEAFLYELARLECERRSQQRYSAPVGTVRLAAGENLCYLPTGTPPYASAQPDRALAHR